jgi:hypothetical protein
MQIKPQTRVCGREVTVSGFVGAQHEFQDAVFVQGWADRFVPSAPRIALFDLVLLRHLFCTTPF